MGEAYLDWQNKSGGIQLNDVVEQYKYVAAGQNVKKGDFLIFVGEDVAPAAEPPFKGIALSSGTGGTQVKVAKIYVEPLFPTDWTYISDKEYVSSNGMKLTSSYASASAPLTNIFDGGISTYASFGSAVESWAQLELPYPVSMSETSIRIVLGSTTVNPNASLQASNNGTSWDTIIETLTSSTMTTYKISNTNKYKYWRVFVTKDTTTGVSLFYEWQITEEV